MTVTPWSDFEKRKFLVALQKHGASDIALLQAEIKTKSATEIRYEIEKYTKKAHNKWNTIDKEQEEEFPINTWIKLLKRMFVKDQQIQDIVPRALKYIAFFEERDDVSSSVHLRDAYIVLSELCKGVAPKDMDQETSHFFYKCLSQLAVYTKNRDNTNENEFINSIKHLQDRMVKTYRRKNQVSPALNPFQIPDKLLVKDDNFEDIIED